MRELQRAVDYSDTCARTGDNMAASAPHQQLDTFWSRRLPNARSELATLITEPPQQKLELSETNKCMQRATALDCQPGAVCFGATSSRIHTLAAAADSWRGATEAQERDFYKATFRLFQSGLSEALCNVLREKSHPHLLPYLAGNVPLNYYLKHNFNAPAPVPTNDLDIKVDFGEHMRAILAEKGGGPPKNKPDKATWSKEEKAVVRRLALANSSVQTTLVADCVVTLAHSCGSSMNVSTSRWPCL